MLLFQRLTLASGSVTVDFGRTVTVKQIVMSGASASGVGENITAMRTTLVAAPILAGTVSAVELLVPGYLEGGNAGVGNGSQSFDMCEQCSSVQLTISPIYNTPDEFQGSFSIYYEI